ncbi:MAG: glycogen-binding domain-containing protein [Spirochaetota bacterium]|nr:glycogen-binding domain-containing protein [Spirochaetota bacterium]
MKKHIFWILALLFSACVTREIVLKESGTVIPLGPQVVPGGVWFAVVIPDAQTVTVAGSFNGWRPAEYHLTNTSALRLWSGFVPITTPGEAQFKYIRNGYDWRSDPCARRVSDGMGGKNSVVVIPAPVSE